MKYKSIKVDTQFLFILSLECFVYRLIMKQKCHFLVSLSFINKNSSKKASARRRISRVNGVYTYEIVTDLYCLSIKSYQYRSKRAMNVIMELKYNKFS